MKQKDFFFILFAIIIILPFIPFSFLTAFQKSFLYNESYWVITTFIKFALLATLGEIIGLRIKSGSYIVPGFGIFPRAIVWGVLGLSIKLSFVVFGSGVPIFLEKSCGLTNTINAMKFNDLLDAFNNGLGGVRLLTAFSISVCMNLIFAPIMMTLHKITDTHITNNQGTVKGLFTFIKFKEIFPSLNWFVQWDFVFKRTIPFFWIPAHTITFLLPNEYRIAFAAILGVALGIILSIASLKSKK